MRGRTWAEADEMFEKSSFLIACPRGDERGMVYLLVVRLGLSTLPTILVAHELLPLFIPSRRSTRRERRLNQIKHQNKAIDCYLCIPSMALIKSYSYVLSSSSSSLTIRSVASTIWIFQEIWHGNEEYGIWPIMTGSSYGALISLISPSLDFGEYIRGTSKGSFSTSSFQSFELHSEWYHELLSLCHTNWFLPSQTQDNGPTQKMQIVQETGWIHQDGLARKRLCKDLLWHLVHQQPFRWRYHHEAFLGASFLRIKNKDFPVSFREA